MSFLHRIVVASAALVLAFFPLCGHASGDGTITVSADDQLKFDVTAIEGTVGQPLIILLINNGSIMAHNLVILKPGADAAAFVASAIKQAGNGYLPNDDQAGHIAVATKLLDGGDRDKITFTPTSPGVYEYVCTYPGHFEAGMRGKITVK